MSQSIASLRPESSISDYRRGRRVGKGGQGSVYQYTDRQTGDLYAVKLVEYDFDDCTPKGRPKNEINILRETYVSPRLAHAHLLRAYAVFEYEEGFAIIMPYFHRGSLRKSPPPLTEFKDAIRQILEALRHLHERGQIHRDIKSENVLVRSEKDQPLDLVVADYGLISLDNPVSFCGSLGYAAPEIVQNMSLPKAQGRLYSNKVDIYALGMLILGVLGVDVPRMWIQNRQQFNNFIIAPIAAELDACDPNSIERYGALSTVDSMLRFDPEDRPSVDECLRLPWLSGSTETPQAGQLAGTSSNLSTNDSLSLSARSIVDPETWWHSTPRSVGLTQHVRQDNQAGGRYDFRKRRQSERHNPISALRKNRIQKRPHESLPTPRSTPDNKKKVQKPNSSHPLERSKSGDPKTGQEAVQETGNLLSWDKMEISD